MELRPANLTRPEAAITVCVAASAALIAGAHLFERLGNLAPCLLCLDQREVHWAVLATGAITLAATKFAGRADRTVAAALGALTLLYVFSAGLAGYHSGVEWGIFPGPTACSAGGTADLGSASDILASLSEPAAGPSCSEAAWRLFGISMAGYNALISLALAVVAGVSCRRAARGLHRDRVGSPILAE